MAKASPSEITIAYKAFDPHELLVHFLAVRGGYYEDAGLKPKLLDAAFIPDAELPERTFLVACGSALLSRIAGVPIKIVLVACHKPMFWLRGDPKYRDSLQGARIATFPPPSPPAHLLRATLRGQGLDPDADVELVPARDDASRLGQLGSGDVDVAMISSAAVGAAERLEAPEIGDVGESIPAPSTGLAVSDELLSADRSRVVAMVDAHRAALADLAQPSEDVSRALMGDFGYVEVDAQDLLTRIPSRMSPDGAFDLGLIDAVLASLGPELGGAAALNPEDVVKVVHN